MTVKLIAIDVDGTLISAGEDIAPRVRAAVRAARQAGVLVILATGRRYASAKQFVDALGLDGPMIVSGGSIICEASSGEISYEAAIAPAGVTVATDLIRDAGMQPLLREMASLGHRLHTGQQRYDDEPSAIYISREPDVVRLAHHQLRRVPNIMMVGGLSHDEAMLQRLSREIASIPDLSPLVLPYGPGVLPSAVIDVFPVGTGKGSAMRMLAEKLGISLSQVMAIGDGINDLDLLEVVGLPVVVANAIPEAKALAKEIVSSNDEDGVAEAIERFVLGSPSRL